MKFEIDEKSAKMIAENTYVVADELYNLAQDIWADDEELSEMLNEYAENLRKLSRALNEQLGENNAEA